MKVMTLRFRTLPMLLSLLSLTGAAVAVDQHQNANTAITTEFSKAIEPRSWSFPRDHGRHDGFKTEWWYFTGNLRDPTGRPFGYQLTFFRTAYAPTATSRPSAWGMNDLYFAHAAISDLSGKSFVFKDRLQRGRHGLAMASDQTLDVTLQDWSAQLTGDTIKLSAKDEGFNIDLTCGEGRGPILQGIGGVNAKGPNPGQASYYYSMTRLKNHGSLQIAGKTYTVDGQSWMDHEFSSNALSPQQVGWDWLGLTLDDGTDLMIYRLRNAGGGADYLSGTLIASDAKPRYLAAAQLKLSGSNPWKSPASGGAYPQVWKLEITGRDALTIQSLLPNQELITPGSTDVNYFEGAVDVLNSRGNHIGDGYLEMTGYAKPLAGAL
jgi:predicted secreted hydrolase